MVKNLHEERPIQTRQRVADEEVRAAELHISAMEYVREHPEMEEYYGSEDWNTHWYQKHSEAAYYTLHPEKARGWAWDIYSWLMVKLGKR